MRAAVNAIMVTAVLTLTLISGLMTDLNAREPGNSCDQDCLFLLAVLNTVLDKALRADDHGLLLSNYVLRACVNPDLRDLHFTVYSTLQRYYSLAVEHKMLEQSDTLITHLLTNLKRIEIYAEKLHGCSHDKESSRALVTKIRLKVEQLVNRVEKIADVTLQYVSAMIKPEKDFYEPGETVSIVLYKNGSITWISRPVILLLPDMLVLPLNYTTNITDEVVQLNLEIPSAILVETTGAGRLTGGSPVSFILALETDKGLKAVKVLKVRYNNPGVYVSVPTTVKRGDPLLVQVQADGHYSATVLLNGEPLLNITYTFRPGENLVEVSTIGNTTRVGLNVLRICVNATLKTISRCFEYPFYVEPRHPNIEIHIPASIVTWTGKFGIALYSREEVELYCTISSSFESKSFRLKDEFYMELHTGVFPVQKLSITLRVSDPSGEFDDLVTVYSVIAVNLLSLFVFLFAISLIPALLGDHERVFVSVIIKSLRETRLSALSTIDKLREELVKPYTTVLSSSIAELYYKAIGKMGLRLPSPFETLREHYYGVVSTRLLSQAVKALLWKLLVLAERELYSTRKPEYKDAHKLYEDVLDAVSG